MDFLWLRDKSGASDTRFTSESNQKMEKLYFLANYSRKDAQIVKNNVIFVLFNEFFERFKRFKSRA